MSTRILAAIPEWQERANCTGTHADAFYPELGKPSTPAKRICRNCDVKQECLEYALTNNEEFGIWGGTTERERRALKKAAA